MEDKLPEGWEWKKLGEIAEINPKFDRQSISGNIEVTFLPMKCIEELTGNVDISNIKNIEEVSRGYTPLIENDLLYAKITPCMENGKIAIAKGLKNNLGFASTEFHIIRFKKNEYNKFFFFYLIQKRIREYAAMNMTGSAGQKRVPANFLNNLLVPLPPFETQQKIVSILEKVEETKKLRAQADELTQKLLQSVFLEIFGDPMKNPRYFSIVKLSEVGEVSSGLTLNNQRSSKKENLFPYLRVANVFRNRLDLSELKYIHISNSEIDRYMLKKNDVLIVEGHGNIDEIGRAAVWKEEVANCAHQNHIIKVRLNENYMRPHFVSYFLNMHGSKGYFYSKSRTTSGLNTISTNKVRDVEIFRPPIDLQLIFEKIVLGTEITQQSQNQSSLEINNLFNALMQKAFTGELVS